MARTEHTEGCRCWFEDTLRHLDPECPRCIEIAATTERPQLGTPATDANRHPAARHRERPP